jgi:Bacterial SCP ortholog
MPARRPDPRGPDSVAAAVAALDVGQDPDPGDLRTAARYLLQLLAARHPGRVLEVRIPPVAAVQCLPGPVHTRGTPPNVVETDPGTWVRLAIGRLEWAAAVASGAVHASGPRADLAAYLPIERIN